MPLFRYQALTDTGKKTSGVIDADSFTVAKQRLRREQIMVTHLEALEAKRREITLPPSLLLSFTRELAQLLRAGLPLYESLLTIEEKYRKNKAHPLFLDLCDKLKGGSSLSAALQAYSLTFDEVYLSMVKAAEQTGALPKTFEQLSLLLSKHQKLKKQLLSALTYPAFLGGFCVIVLFSLLFFVVPMMAELFEGRTLHPVTQTVLSLSRFLKENVLLLSIALLLLVAMGVYAWRHPKSKKWLHSQFLNIPFVKTIVLESAIIRLTRSLSLLLAGGVPLVEALRLSRKVMKHPPLEEVVEKAQQKIVEGKPLSHELKLSPLVPSLVVRMLEISEETGRMAPMLHNISEIYEEKLEKNLLQLTTFLQPVLLIVLGLIVGVVLLSVLLPLTDVGSLLDN